MAINYKVGDRIVVVRDEGSCVYDGITGTVTAVSPSTGDPHPISAELDLPIGSSLDRCRDFSSKEIALASVGQVDKVKGETTMGIASKIKELALSSDERLLRRVGLKDSDGEWTAEATEVLNDILLEERKADIIAKAKEVEAEEKKAKKESK